MKIIKVNKKVKSELTKFIVDNFNNGKVIILPTDTIYGLHCRASDKKAIRKIIRIKKRDNKKPFIVLISSISMANQICQINKKQRELLKNIWMKNRPTTVVLKAKNNPLYISNKSDSVAVRLPKNDFLIKIIKRLNKPLVSSSFNLSGQKSLESLNNLNLYFKKFKPDIGIDVGQLSAKASKIIDLRDINNIKIIRK